MATNESIQLRDIQNLTQAAQSKIQTTVAAARLQLELPDLMDALPTIRGLLDSLAYYVEDLVNDVDLACEDHAASPV
jgi:hypothetical protein